MTREESIEFYKAHSKRLYNISLRIVCDSGEAEEIMQDTLLKYITGGFRVGQGEAQTAWLNKTCVRASIDALRKKKRERIFLDEYDTANKRTQEVDRYAIDFEALPEIKVIHEAIDKLRDPYRLVLTLVLIDGLDYEEISEFSGEREGTIRTQFSRAKKMLADIMKQMIDK